MRTLLVNRLSTFGWRKFSVKATKKLFPLSRYTPDRIKNFSIIAHIDHGKSTLADRLLEYTGVISKSNTNAQVLDKLQVERERGITVKAQTCALQYHHKGVDYLLNLIDTPGHVDFSYEVKRSLSACDSVILLVDANDGVQAQTVANFYLAFERELTIIPVINKIDLPNARPENVKAQMKHLFDIDPESVIQISAKHGVNIDQLLEALIERTPSPTVGDTSPNFLRSLIIDTWFQNYRGVIPLVIVKEGSITEGSAITSHHLQKSYNVKEVGIFNPDPIPVDILSAGQVGYVVTGMKSSNEALVGDTLRSTSADNLQPLEKFQPAKSVVFAGLFPNSQSDYDNLRSALEKLLLNDCSVSVQKDTNVALGAGWRLGFLGLLHMDVFKQRLEQEYDADIILTTPSVPYKVCLKSGEWIDVTCVTKMPNVSEISEYQELMVLGTIISPENYLNEILKICGNRRGNVVEQSYIDSSRLLVRCILPLNEIVVGFYDQLKSVTSGYASFDYEEHGWETTDLIKLDVLINGMPVNEFSLLVHKSCARSKAFELSKLLANEIPRQQFLIKIQVVINSKVISKEEIKPFRKDVTQKLYGGDVTRKNKLLKRQTEGKKKMRMLGKVEISRDTFINVIRQS